MRPPLRSLVLSACSSRVFTSLEGDPRVSCSLIETVADLVQVCCSEIEHARRITSASRRSAVHMTSSSSTSSTTASAAAPTDHSHLPSALVINIDPHEPAAFAALCSIHASIRAAAWRLLQQLRSLHTLCYCAVACDGPVMMPVESRPCLADVLEASLPVVCAREAGGEWGSAVGTGVTSSFNGFVGGGASAAAAAAAAAAAGVNKLEPSSRSRGGGGPISMDAIVRNAGVDHQQVWLRVVGEFGKIIRSTCSSSVSDGVFVCCSSRALAISQSFPSLSKSFSYISSTSQSPAFSHCTLLEAAASAAAAKSAALSVAAAAAAAAGSSDAPPPPKAAGSEGGGGDLSSIFKKNDADAQVCGFRQKFVLFVVYGFLTWLK